MVEIKKITDVMQHLDGLKAVVFDLDDTLYSEEEYVKSGYHAIAQCIPEVKNAEAKLWQAFKSKKLAIDDVLANEGIYSKELKQQCLEVYRFHQPDIHLYDGVLSMLIKLRQNGYLLGIITDGRPEGQRAKIKALNLKQFVDYIIVTDELGGIQFRKPCEMAFRIIRNHYGLPFEQIAYVGDNVTKDFQAPEQLGMRSIWVNNANGLYKDNHLPGLIY